MTSPAEGIEMRLVDDGVIIAVQAQPGSRRNAITGVHDKRLKVAVTQVAEKGKANQEIVKLLAGVLGVAKSQIAVVSGETNSKKSIRVQGRTASELIELLSRHL
ncbi:DUF167 domain-containing protein [Planctomicrobium sp. SH527]|uniref:DUF167 domain-containing protein n=1 Tax=Planctomicrobium sp. SH527 TaxID=3448123 RepID=UPI003F5B25DE